MKLPTMRRRSQEEAARKLLLPSPPLQVSPSPSLPVSVFLPFMGEFGFLVCQHVPFVHSHPGPKIVFCQRGQECLFPSAAEFRHDWANPVPDRSRVGDAMGARGVAAEYDRLIALFPAGTTIVRPERSNYHRCGQPKFWPSVPNRLPAMDVVVCARLRRTGQSRNYPHWPGIVAALRAAGLKVGLAGAPETSATIEADGLAWNHPDGPTAGTVDLLERCRLYLGTDTGVSHLAAMLDVPSLLVPHSRAVRIGSRLRDIQRAHRGLCERLPDEVHDDPSLVTRRALEFLRGCPARSDGVPAVPSGVPPLGIDGGTPSLLARASQPRAGVVILSVGAKRTPLLAQSAATVRRLMPGVGLKLFTDHPLPGYDCTPVPTTRDRATREHKINLLAVSPWDFNLLLDDDCAVLRQFSGVEAALDGADLALSTDPFCPTMSDVREWQKKYHWSTQAENEYTQAHFPEGIHRSSGVIFWRRCPAVAELARVWLDEWRRFRDVDQLALYRAIQRTGLDVKELDPRLHYRTGLRDKVKEPVIVHFGGNKWKSAEWLLKNGYPARVEPAPAPQPSAPVNFPPKPRRHALHGAFDRVCIINLASRTDRRDRLALHLHEIGWPFRQPEWVTAKPGAEVKAPAYWTRTPGLWACGQTHLGIIERAWNDGLQHVLIMEDDVVFLPGFLDRAKFLLQHAPANWGILMFGGCTTPYYRQQRITGEMFRVHGMNNVECYAISRRFMPRAIESLRHARLNVDETLSHLHWEAPAYTMRPPIACQWAGRSDNFPGWKSNHGRLPPPDGSSGALILSIGPRRRLLLANAAASLRRNMPQLALRLFTDHPLPGYDCTVTDSLADRSRAWKTRLFELCPFEHGILLDDDTITLRQFDGIERVLAGADLALMPDAEYPRMAQALDLHRQGWGSEAESHYTRAQFPDCGEHPHYNSGVIFFRRTPALLELGHLWHEEWQRFQGVDQLALYRALRRSGLTVQPLPPELHQNDKGLGDSPNPGIVHLLASKWNVAQWLDQRGLPVILPLDPKPCGGCGSKSTAPSLHPSAPPREAPAWQQSARGQLCAQNRCAQFRLHKGQPFCDAVNRYLALHARPTAADCPRGFWQPESWGPPLWAKLHGTESESDGVMESGSHAEATPSLHHSITPSLRYSTTPPLPALVAEVTAALPCPDCRAHWLADLAKFPPDTSTPAAFAAWASAAHARVRARLGQPPFGLDTAPLLHHSMTPPLPSLP